MKSYAQVKVTWTKYCIEKLEVFIVPLEWLPNWSNKSCPLILSISPLLVSLKVAFVAATSACKTQSLYNLQLHLAHCFLYTFWCALSLLLKTNLKKVTNYLKFKKRRAIATCFLYLLRHWSVFCSTVKLTVLTLLIFPCHSAAAGSSAHCHACMKTRMTTSDAIDGLFYAAWYLSLYVTCVIIDCTIVCTANLNVQ